MLPGFIVMMSHLLIPKFIKIKVIFFSVSVICLFLILNVKLFFWHFVGFLYLVYFFLNEYIFVWFGEVKHQATFLEYSVLIKLIGKCLWNQFQPLIFCLRRWKSYLCTPVALLVMRRNRINWEKITMIKLPNLK